MGIQSKITSIGRENNNSGNKTYTGSHAISTDRVLAATSADVITPLNPGNFESIRSQSVVTSPRYYSDDEATALRNEAKAKTKAATATEKAYKALKQIEKADTSVHKSHRSYEKTLAKTEVEKKRSDASLAKKLHTLRPQYTAMGAGIERAENRANQRVVEITAKIKAIV